MLALNARNDPFVPGASLPTAAELSTFVTLDAPRQGGHVGFVAARQGPGRRYLAQRVFAFLEQHA
jgi:predicted alpha/beta-fold hydrolase